MKIITMGRGQGKTTKLCNIINVLEELGIHYVLCVSSRHRVDYIERKLGYRMDQSKFGLVVSGLNGTSLRGYNQRVVLIDDLDDVLSDHFGTSSIFATYTEGIKL